MENISLFKSEPCIANSFSIHHFQANEGGKGGVGEWVTHLDGGDCFLVCVDWVAVLESVPAPGLNFPPIWGRGRQRVRLTWADRWLAVIIAGHGSTHLSLTALNPVPPSFWFSSMALHNTHTHWLTGREHQCEILPINLETCMHLSRCNIQIRCDEYLFYRQTHLTQWWCSRHPLAQSTAQLRRWRCRSTSHTALKVMVKHLILLPGHWPPLTRRRVLITMHAHKRF